MQGKREANTLWKTCANLNHRRPDPPVRNCVDCGKLLSGKLALTECTEEDHARRRRGRSAFCPDCGKRLTGD